MRKLIVDRTSVGGNRSKMTSASTIAISKESLTVRSIFLLNLDLYATLFFLTLHYSFTVLTLVSIISRCHVSSQTIKGEYIQNSFS